MPASSPRSSCRPLPVADRRATSSPPSASSPLSRERSTALTRIIGGGTVGRQPTPSRRVPGSAKGNRTMSERAVQHVRKFLGQRVRALRKQRGLSQERLGDRAGLSGKFIGEVERGEKSISIDSLYRVSVALEIPLRELTDVRADKPSAVPSEEAEKIFALVSGRRRPEDIRKAYRVLQAIFGKAPWAALRPRITPQYGRAGTITQGSGHGGACG